MERSEYHLPKRILQEDYGGAHTLPTDGHVLCLEGMFERAGEPCKTFFYNISHNASIDLLEFQMQMLTLKSQNPKLKKMRRSSISSNCQKSLVRCCAASTPPRQKAWDTAEKKLKMLPSSYEGCYLTGESVFQSA